MSILHNFIDTKNRLALQRAWYNTPQLQKYWIEILQFRETAMLSPSWTKEVCNKRMQQCNTINEFKQAIYYSPINDCSKLNNIYYSLATFKTFFPLFRKGEIEAKHDYKQNIWKDFESYDIVIDIDAPDHKHIQSAFKDMQKVHNHLAQQKTRHYIRFSGKGFHIFLLPSMKPLVQEDFNPENENNIYKQCAAIAKELHDKYSELIDLKIYESRRVIKLPFSLSHYEDITYLCAPLRRISIEEWDTFKLDLFDINTFLKAHPSFPDYIIKDYIFEYL